MQHTNTQRLRHGLIAAATALTAFCLLMLTAIPSWAMTVTFIRHGESFANAGNSIDTSIPGPSLTAQGQSEAAAVGTEAWVAKYGTIDAIFASTMVRTQETAAPLSKYLGTDPGHPMPITVLGGTDYINEHPGTRIGVQEITSGIFTGLPEKDGLGRIGYIVAPLMWTMGLQFVSVPGGENGLEFNERMTNALNVIEQTTPEGTDGKQNAAVFSHGATIMMWTMMNVDNPDLLLLMQHPLGNTDVVVVSGSNEEGWHLESWAGQPVGDANYPTQMLVNLRSLIVAPQQAVYNMRKPVLNLDPGTIASTAGDGIVHVGKAGVTFVKDSVNDTINAIRGLVPSTLSSATTTVSKTTPNALRANSPTIAAFAGTVPATESTPITDQPDAAVNPGSQLKSMLNDATGQGRATLSTVRANAAERAGARAQQRQVVPQNVRDLGTTVTSAVERAGQNLGEAVGIKPKAKTAATQADPKPAKQRIKRADRDAA
ncbi:MAG: histidine phosphatase family protein [Mycolicibacterium sp.]|nr:histidine phosphatase family protein [Mycolicibacterium sp.]